MAIMVTVLDLAQRLDQESEKLANLERFREWQLARQRRHSRVTYITSTGREVT